MKAVIGMIIIVSIINGFFWFVFSDGDFTPRENLRNFIIAEIVLIAVVIACGFITDWR